MLAIGSTAPDFTSCDQDEHLRSLSDQIGKWTLVYFYPKDDTPGCTTEACAIRDVYNDFERLGVTVFGISKDTSNSHRAFATKYELPFTLLSDGDGAVIKAYDAWGKKKLFGKAFEGILRISYLIGPDQRIVRAYPNVDPAAHALELIADLKDLV